jgi:hypothetical protein
MKIRSLMICVASSGLNMVLAGCGGGGGGGVASIPAPPVTTLTPTPTPTPSPTPTPQQPPIPAGPIGLVSTAPFKTYSAYANALGLQPMSSPAIQIAYSTADNRYTITLPDYQPGQLVTLGGSGSVSGGAWTHLDSTYNAVTLGTSDTRQTVSVTLAWPGSSPYRYTSIGSWNGQDAGGATGVFVYGIPTATGDVPLTGSASYSGQVSGVSNLGGTPVYGSVLLNFDFAAGALSGVMKPAIAPVWDEIALGDYTFRDTVFARGSTSFSGGFNVPGSSGTVGATLPSAFQGNFTGPQAAELMANWTAPMQDPASGGWTMMSGVWIAKKP